MAGLQDARSRVHAIVKHPLEKVPLEQRIAVVTDPEVAIIATEVPVVHDVVIPVVGQVARVAAAKGWMLKG